MKELTEEQIARIKARQEAYRPFIPCSLMNHWDWSCDNCRETVDVKINDRHYFCVKEIGEYGIAQWKESSFTFLKKKSGMTWLKWRDDFDQVVLLDWCLRNGYENHWMTHKRAEQNVVIRRYIKGGSK